MSALLEKAFNCFFIASFMAIVASGVVIVYPKYQRALSLEQRKADNQKHIDGLQVEISNVREKQQRFRNDREFVESLARENCRMFPGELVFVFKD